MQKLDYSVVVPVFRGFSTLSRLCQRVVDFFEQRGSSFQIILVDDASRDGSWQVIQRLTSGDPRIVGIQLTRNFGQHNATACGIRCAESEFTVTLDEDLQNPPEEIASLIDCQRRTGADVVYGIAQEGNRAFWRKAASRVAMSIPRYVMQVDFDISSFRLMRTSIAAEAAKSARHDIILDACLSWTTDRITATEVCDERSARPSTYSVARLVGHFLKLLCNYTTLPLRAATIGGGAMALVSLVAGCGFIVMHLSGYAGVPGHSSLIVSIFFSTGVILLGVGVMSEYLARIFLHINRKPQAVIRQTTRDKPDENHRRAA